MGYVRLLVTVLVICTTACAMGSREIPDPPHPIPLVRVLARPSEFDRTVITVFGFLVYSDYEKALYLSESDAVHAILPNGIQIDIAETDDVCRTLAIANGKYAILIGEYRAPISNTQLIESGRFVTVLSVLDESEWDRGDDRPF